MSCDDVRELLEGYALGVLDPDEENRVEAHLASCADCRRLVARYREILAGFPEALALASPLQLPDTIKERLLTMLEGETAEAHAKPLPRTAAWRPGGRRRRLLVLAAASLLALSVAATAALGLALDRERELKDRFAGLLDQRELVLEVVDGRGTERAFLRPADRGSTSYGKLFTNPELRHVVVLVGRLPKPPDDTQYAVWLTRDGETTRRGALQVNEKGFGLLVFDAPRAGPRYDAARVVLQQAGARTPRGETVLRWTRER
jgi:anti-sigma-K factor RskA